MRTHCLLAATLLLVLNAVPVWAQGPVLDLEVATAPNAPFSAQQAWYRLLSDMALDSLRLRQARRGEEPSLENVGTDASPHYRMVAVVDAKNELHLPGGRFSTRDRGRLAEYLRRLREDGIEGVTASRGLFGLTEKQFEEVHAELSPQVEFGTAGKRPRQVVGAIADRVPHRLVIGPASLKKLNAAEPFPGELQGLSRGTVLAILFRQAGLAFRPQRQSGELLYQVMDVRQAEQPTRKPQRDPESLETWPVGWEPEHNPGRTAPGLFDIISAQIDGYTLGEALEAIGTRLDVPLIVDQQALQARNIDLSEVQVQLPSGRYSYDRILSRILFQGRLKGTLRVDEGGKPFYWITPL